MAAAAERAEAKAAGLSRYWTGRPCKRGHVAERQTSSAGCMVCIRAVQQEYDIRKREERRRKNRDRKRAKKIGARFEIIPPACQPTDEPKESISLLAHEGPNEADTARAWVDQQAARLGVTSNFIIVGVRNRWTLTEIEKLPRDHVGHLADHVSEHLCGDGFTRWEDCNHALGVGGMG